MVIFYRSVGCWPFLGVGSVVVDLLFLLLPLFVDALWSVLVLFFRTLCQSCSSRCHRVVCGL